MPAQKSLSIAIVVTILALLVLYFFLSENNSYVNYPPKGSSIVAFGDSLTQGVGAADQGGFPEIISRRIGVPITNKGVSGDTTEQALGRVERDVIALSPDIVIVEFGGNDHLRKVPRETTFTNLRAIIKKIQESGAFVILVGVRGGLLSDSWNEEFSALAKETGSLYFPDILDGLFGDTRLMSDAIHPNQAGYEKIADRMTPLLLEVLSTSSLPAQ